MIPINNSDTAWLIVADFNQDNDIGYPDCLREDVYNPETNGWTPSYHGGVGGWTGIDVGVGDLCLGVGYNQPLFGGEVGEGIMPIGYYIGGLHYLSR